LEHEHKHNKLIHNKIHSLMMTKFYNLKIINPLPNKQIHKIINRFED
jgi:hypothetical protein